MPRPKVDPSEKRREILATAESLIDRFGPQKVTMQDISAAHGMSQSNIYRFFANKEALLASLADQWFDEIETELERVMQSSGTPREIFDAFIRTQFTMKRDRYDSNPALFVSYLQLATNNPVSVHAHVAKLSGWLRTLVNDCHPAGKAPRRVVDLVADMTVKFRDPHLISAHRKECTNARLEAVLNAVHNQIAT